MSKIVEPITTGLSFFCLVFGYALFLSAPMILGLFIAQWLDSM
jgi:hypothetical protein